MFSKTAQYYDAIYKEFKDYDSECESVTALIKARHPSAATLLDVACGTGEHAKILCDRHNFQVDGIDLDPALIEQARAKNPTRSFEIADMRAFSLGKNYDIVMCLFSSIAYAKTLDGVTETLGCFAKHINPSGLVIVEPWFPPEMWKPGRVYMKTAETPEFSICRMSLSEQEGTLSRLRFEYLIGDKEGLTRESEVHELGLFTVEEMLAAFAEVGLAAEYLQQGLSDRGLYVAKRQQP